MHALIQLMSGCIISQVRRTETQRSPTGTFPAADVVRDPQMEGVMEDLQKRGEAVVTAIRHLLRRQLPVESKHIRARLS